MASFQLPARMRWSHNAHYHRWLLGQLPAQPGRLLDVGCGTGALARTLAQRAVRVDAVDVSPQMIATARRRDRPGGGQVRWLVGDVLDEDLALADGGYDAVTAVASLHHLPLDEGVERLGSLVRPGGVLVVVGLYRAQTLGEHCLDVVAVVANALFGIAVAVTGRAGAPEEDAVPVRAPVTTLAQVREVAAVLPGACITRGLYWRYLLTWQHPPRP